MMAGTQLHPYLEKHLEFLATQAYTQWPVITCDSMDNSDCLW